MTPAEVVASARAAGLELIPLDGGRLYARPKAALTDELRKAIREHKDRLVAVLQLREVHRAMGLSEEDVLFVEDALLSGKVGEIRIVSRPPSGATA